MPVNRSSGKLGLFSCISSIHETPHGHDYDPHLFIESGRAVAALGAFVVVATALAANDRYAHTIWFPMHKEAHKVIFKENAGEQGCHLEI